MILNSLNDIKYSDNKIQYKYKNIEFLTSLKKTDKLVVMFHAARCKARLPIF